MLVQLIRALEPASVNQEQLRSPDAPKQVTPLCAALLRTLCMPSVGVRWSSRLV